MPAKHDPQHPAPAGPRPADKPPDDEAARQAEAIRTASDTVLLEELRGRQHQAIQAAPQVAIEAELTARGYHYDSGTGTWEK
jgi:hypothetical protein